jgi:outer membrane protein assembly factor BamB
VPKGTLAALRKQVAESKSWVAARQVAKLLIDKKLLAPDAAQRLLAGSASKVPQSTAASQAKGQRPKTALKESPPAPAVGSGLTSLLDDELAPLPGFAPSTAGPLDALLNDPTLAAAIAEASPLDIPAAPKKKAFFKSVAGPIRTGGRQRARRLLWTRLGVAAAAFLLVVAVTIWTLTRPGPGELLEPADAQYESGSYAEAIVKYDVYLAYFPNLSTSGRARVRRGLAQLRLNYSATADGSDATGVASDILPAICAEPEFDDEAGAVLATLLPPVAERLALRARKQPSPALIAEAEQALTLAKSYIPVADIPRQRLGRVEASLALTRHRIAGDDELKAAITTIERAVAEKDFSAAYRARTKLTNAYPDLSSRDELVAAVLHIASAAQAAVASVAKRQPAQKATPAGPLTTILLSRRTFHSEALGVQGHVIPVAAGGVVYGLKASDGSVLWRKFVGLGDADPHDGDIPTVVSPQPGSDLILAAASQREIQRVEAATGRIVWRSPIEDRLCAEPVVADGQVFAATRQGHVMTIDAATGDTAEFVQLPQSLAVRPAVDPRHKLLFQLADQDNLFVLTLPTGRCRQVFSLGHQPGAVAAPPVVFGDCLLIAVNDTESDSSLRVLKIDAEGTQSPPAVLRLAQTIRLKGRVDVAPSVAGERLLVATDAGQLVLLEAAPAGGKETLREVARCHHTDGDRLIRFPLLGSDACFLGDNGLSCLEVRTVKKQLVTTWSDASQGAVCQRPVAIGQTVFCVRHLKDMPGVAVAAVTADKAEPHWQTCLAAPLATEPIVDPSGGRIAAVTVLGDVFQLDASALGNGAVADHPATPPADLRQPVTAVIHFSGDRLVLACASGSDQVVAFDPANPEKQCRAWRLPGAPGCSPISFGAALLAPSDLGQVYLLEPDLGNALSEPFQPRLQPGTLLPWQLPVTVGEQDIVISDGRSKLYRLRLVDKPRLHLEADAERDLASPLASPLAATTKVVCAVNADRKLDVFQLPDLTSAGQHDLAGRAAWGPRRVGDRVMLATDSGQLCCFDESGQPLWQVALPYGPLAGAPLLVGDHYILAAAGGVVWRAAAASGKELAKVDTGQPLATGPVLLGERILLGGHDGSLHQLTPP